MTNCSWNWGGETEPHPRGRPREKCYYARMLATAGKGEREKHRQKEGGPPRASAVWGSPRRAYPLKPTRPRRGHASHTHGGGRLGTLKLYIHRLRVLRVDVCTAGGHVVRRNGGESGRARSVGRRREDAPHRPHHRSGDAGEGERGRPDIRRARAAGVAASRRTTKACSSSNDEKRRWRCGGARHSGARTRGAEC
jgi:hypothetical protein